MNEFQEELGQIEVEPDEVREILRRLAFAEYGGPEQTRVADIAETTGTPPETIGRILADIRGTPWEEWRERIDATITHHEERIETLETRPASVDQLDDVELYERVLKGKRAAQGPMWPVSIFGFIMLAGFVIALANKNAGPHYDPHQWYPGLTQVGVNGRNYGYNGACVLSEATLGGAPVPVTEQHEAEAEMAMMNVHCP